ncbi:MAG: hypothetical protein RPT25_08505 [Cycloclasticus sp.]|jgi:hypothetical protein
MPLIVLPLLVLASILSYGFGKLGGLLPLTLSNLLIFSGFSISVLYSMRIKTFLYNKYYLVFGAYILLATLAGAGGGVGSGIHFFSYYIIYSFTILTTIYLVGVESFFKLYIKFAIFLAAFAVFQVISDLIGFPYLNDLIRLYSENKNSSRSGGILRATSFASEPAVLGLYLLPVLVLSVFRLMGQSNLSQYISIKNACLILSAILMTFSLLVYLYVGMICTYYMVKSKNFIALSIGGVFLFAGVLGVNYSESINERVDELSRYEELIDSRQLSVFAIVSNLIVVKESMSTSPFMGTGAVSHGDKYDGLIHLYVEDGYSGIGLNRDDGASLYLRFLSEFGLIGLALYLFLLIKGGRGGKSFDGLAEIFLFSLILYGIRYGSINITLFWLFLSCFIFSLKHGGLVRFEFGR